MDVNTVSVIGATGYLGSHVSSHLASAGFQVRAWGRRRPEGHQEWAKPFAAFETGDLTDDGTLDRVLADKSDAVVYCVSMDHHETESDLDRAWKVNVRPVWRLLDRLSGRQSLRFVYLSTAQVYGLPKGVVDEQTAVNPRNHYALTHLMAELLVRRYNDIPRSICASLRVSNGFGAPVFQDANCWWLVINDFCRTAVKKGKIQLSSDGLQWRNFVHTDNIAAAVELLLSKSPGAVRSSIYNVGGSRSTTILELAHRVSAAYRSLTGRSVPVVMPDGSTSKGAGEPDAIAGFEYSTAAIEALGYRLAVDLNEGIERLLTHLMRGNRS